ncbi:MAG: S-layer homology domain-containing protein [Ruminococcus sp.]|nr:S-layer homology domain-containing protein [Ruminococcus sp.]
MTFTGTWDDVAQAYRQVEVEATRTIKHYALRVYTTTIPTEYNFYTLAHDDIYRNSSAVYSNCYNQPPHISWYMNDAIEGSEYTTQPDANVTLVSNNYTAKDFDASALPAAGASTTTTGNKFTDISGHWAESYIIEMYNANVINGMTETTFVPDDSVTRGQFVKLIVAALGLEVGTDGADTHWAVPYVTAAQAANLINDAIPVATSEDLETPITREEMASMVVAAAKSKSVTIDTSAATTFTDADSISAWASEDVTGAAALGIVTGFEDGSFKPADGATRGQAATMLSRLFAAIK